MLPFKWKSRKVGFYILGTVLLLALIISLGIAYNFLSQTLVKESDEIRNELNLCCPSGELDFYNFKNHEIRYVRVSNSDENIPVLLMIHGAPGSCGDCAKFWQSSELAKDFELISIDRPGYGPGYPEALDISIKEQVEIIIKLLNDLYQNREVAILSHSYGGPIGALIAKELNSNCIGHIMVAPVMDPDSEDIFWYSSIPLKWPFSMMATVDWKVAALEKLGHPIQLRKLVNEWSTIKSPTVHIHGTDDWLASPLNLDFCAEAFLQDRYSQIVINEGSHFILWDEQVQLTIIKALESLIE